MSNRCKTSTLPTCVACLFRLGWGIKRVSRHAGYAKTTVHRYQRLHGLTDEVTAARKKVAENTRRTAKRVERERHERAQVEARKAERAALKAMGPHLPKRTALDYYYANHEECKERARERAKAHHAMKKNDPAYRAKRKLVHMAWLSKPTNKAKLREQNRVNHKAWRKTDAGRAALKRAKSKPYARLVHNLRRRLRDYVRKNGHTTVQLIGCTSTQLTHHLESLMLSGMTWENYGAWHVDHIKPCAWFDLTKPEQQRACFHYTNLQPLWARDNILKGARYGT